MTSHSVLAKMHVPLKTSSTICRLHNQASRGQLSSGGACQHAGPEPGTMLFTQHTPTAPGCQRQCIQLERAAHTFHWASHTPPRSWLQWCVHPRHWPQSWCPGSSTSASGWSLHPGWRSRRSTGRRCRRRTGTAGLPGSGSLQPPVSMPLMPQAWHRLCFSYLASRWVGERGGGGEGLNVVAFSMTGQGGGREAAYLERMAYVISLLWLI